MQASRNLYAVLLFSLATLAPAAPAQQPAGTPLPDMRQLMREVHEHQKQLEKIRENYTYSSSQVIQELDSNGQVKKTETRDSEVFYVNARPIFRLIKKDGQPLSGDDLDKETKRVAKAVEKAEKGQLDEPDQGEPVSARKILELVDFRNPRRVIYRGRPTIAFDFIGVSNVKGHGINEDLSKKLEGSIWIDEADRQVAHLDADFKDNFRIGGGLVVSVQKGSSFHFDQAPVNGEIWLPTGGEANVQARVLLVKGIRQHATERDYDYKRFRVETQQDKDAHATSEKTP